MADPKPVLTDLASTTDLLRRAREGDAQALDDLFGGIEARCGAGRADGLPRWTRDLRDTEDLVQETLAQTLRHINDFEPRHEGALQAYLRQALINRVRDEVRRVTRYPTPAGIEDDAEHADRRRRRSKKPSAARRWSGTRRRCSGCGQRSAK